MTEKYFERMEEAVLEAFGEPPKPAVRAAHLAAIREQVPEMLPFPSRRRRIFVRAGTAVLGLALVGGSAMAATGSLPDPVQNAVADALDTVVDIPGGENDSAAGGEPKNPIAAANKAEADAYTDAKKAYNACKKEEREAAKASPVPSDSPDASPADSECGEKPVRADFKTDSPKPSKSPKASRSPRPERTPNPNAADPEQKPDDPGAQSQGPAKTERPAPTDRPVPPGLAD